MNYEQHYELQIKREEQSANSGFNKYLKSTSDQQLNSDGSNTDFGIVVREKLIADVVSLMEQKLNELRGSRFRSIINKCLVLSKVNGKVKPHNWMDFRMAAHLGFVATLDTALNPNVVTHKVIGRSGADKKLIQKKNIRELEVEIGRSIDYEMKLRLLRKTFPEWYGKTNNYAERRNNGGNKASTSYWRYRMNRATKEFAEEKRLNSDVEAAELLEGNFWNFEERLFVGNFIFACIYQATGLFEEKKIWKNGKKDEVINLSADGELIREGLIEEARRYAVDVLPMLIEPEPVTNTSLGGWLLDSLQEPEQSWKGYIRLSGKHLQFINRQARVPFQVNPFIYNLMLALKDAELPLGKFEYTTQQSLPTLAQMLGLGSIEDKDEQNRLVKQHPYNKAMRRELEILKDTNLKKQKDGMLALYTLDKARKVLNDEAHYHPVKPDFRGRIYSRIPFVSFQSNDCGRYLIRFAEHKPIDNRTEFWMKVGISNAAGNDKLNWDKRIAWFDRNVNEIVNVGRMMDSNGDFSRAYAFLTQDFIEDAFCLAAIANEYVKVFVDKVQDYTQVFVIVDCSCSGTSIYNAWRLNRAGAAQTNVIDTPEPADIYLAVWQEIKRIAPARTFRKSHLQRLDKSKLIRKMMKAVYVPAQYASSTNEQHYKLEQFNRDVLKPANLHFKDAELDVLKKLWTPALDEVSSINTVVKWFKERTDEAIANGANEIKYTSCNGSVMYLTYPKSKARDNIRTLSHKGSTKLRERQIQEPTDEVNRVKLKNAVTANVTHLTDASALCAALWNFEESWVGLHDAVGLAPSQALDEAIQKLKKGFAEATSYNVWQQFCLDNGLPIDAKTPAPIIGDLDITDIQKSTYLYS